MEALEQWLTSDLWRKAHVLVLDLYKATSHFPHHEFESLTCNVRKAMVGVLVNIVRAEKTQRAFLYQEAALLLEEVKYYLILSYHLNYLKKPKAEALLKEARAVGAALSQRIH